MRVYFVRHGVTDDWEQGLHQQPQSKLSETGRKQAQQIAQRVSKLPIDTIFASVYDRAKETAETIAQTLGKKVELHEILKEIKRPKEVENKQYDDPETIRVMEEIRNNFHRPDWHYSNEENFNDLKLRAIEVVKLLERQSGEHILVVSHGLFIKVVMMVMMMGEDVSPLLFKPINEFFQMSNTGLTIFEKQDHGRTVLTWNDHAHLAE